MPEDTILNLMIAHHGLLNALFILFRDQAKEASPMTGSSLSELSWETKKHFFSEENIIFDYLPLQDEKTQQIIVRLEAEHSQMIKMIANFTRNLPQISEKDMDDFYSLMNSHREVEEKELYPKLDKELLVDQKRQIISRINEIPLVKNV
jgi:hemerythrin-like domain-containing protein